jgi:hypothetical protein
LKLFNQPELEKRGVSMANDQVSTRFAGLRKAISEIFLNEHLQTICIWKVVVPFLLLMILFPVYILIVKVHYPFERAFAHGELLIFSALILIEAAVELKRAQVGFDELLRGFALLAIFLFGFMKYQAIQQEPHLEKGEVEAISQMFAFSFFNCTVAIFAVAASMYAFLHAVRSENIKKVQGLENPR